MVYIIAEFYTETWELDAVYKLEDDNIETSNNQLEEDFILDLISRAIYMDKDFYYAVEEDLVTPSSFGSVTEVVIDDIKTYLIFELHGYDDM